MPFAAIMNAIHKASHISMCMHPKASSQTCGKIINAHTLQRSRVIKALCDSDKKVLTFQLNDEAKFEVKDIGWREASTFNAFCKGHDDELFASLEKTPFAGTAEQIFLTAYRALCWELYQKTRNRKGHETMRSAVLQGAPLGTMAAMGHILSTHGAGTDKGHQELTSAKKEMDADLLSNNFSNYGCAEFVLSGPPIVASIGAISPNYSLSGLPLQKLDVNSKMQWLAFGVDVTDRGSHFTFFWKKNDTATGLYMAEVLVLPDDLLASFLCQFCFMHCENTYFSRQWWQSLSQDDQKYITELMSNVNPYAESPAYDLRRNLASWTLHAKSSTLDYKSPM